MPVSDPEPAGSEAARPPAPPPAASATRPRRRVSIGMVKDVTSIAANLATVAAVAGIVFSVYQYWNSLEDQRVARSLDFVATWSERKLDNDYAILFAAIDAEIRAMTAAQVAAYEKQSDAAQRLILSNLGSTVLGDEETAKTNRLRVHRLFDFFKRVAVCVEETICAARPIEAFLLPYAADVTLYFSGYVSDRRKTDVAFAMELERFVESKYPAGLAASQLGK